MCLTVRNPEKNLRDIGSGASLLDVPLDKLPILFDRLSHLEVNLLFKRGDGHNDRIALFDPELPPNVGGDSNLAAFANRAGDRFALRHTYLKWLNNPNPF